MTTTDEEKKEAPADAEAIRNVIRATVSASGEPDPETLPHLVRERLKGTDTGDMDIDAYVSEVLEEMRSAK
ncbi:hypothetical protein [Parvularcula oceani]|uniref:hypothetical protein n=1 Tax=Parvularcula oceani TaxID=1247963 RepID=UPI0004E0FC69|nr:hypothetical protein [Parvularcula oceani]